jgi:hypothetical protein
VKKNCENLLLIVGSLPCRRWREMYTNQVVNRSSPGIIDTSESKHHQHFNFNYNSIMPDAVNRLSTFLTFDDEKSKFAPLLKLLE